MVNARAAEVSPPDWTTDWTVGATGASTFREDGGGQLKARTQALTFSALRVWELSDSRWYVGAGPGADQVAVRSASPLLPAKLQDVYAQLAVERFEGKEAVAGVILNPGAYFGQTLRSGSWDMPIQAFSGVPLLAGLNGLVGIGNGRFYHHAVPAVGLIWEPSPDWRIEATYPTPAVTYRPTKALALKLGAEITGGGFKTDLPGAPVVEYTSYRVGAVARYTAGDCFLELAGGVEAEGSFDFYHVNRRIHGSGAPYGRCSVEWGF